EHRNDRDRHLPPATSVAAAPAASADRVSPPAAGAVAVTPAAALQLAARLRRIEAHRQRNRRAAMKDPRMWNDGRLQRAIQHRSEIARTWGNAVQTPGVQAELKTHADR